MQLTCPTCEARYEVTDGLIPQRGQHVQCANCQTRWFERPAPAPAPSLVDEDAIITRLEARRPFAAVSAAPLARAAGAGGAARHLEGSEFRWETPTPAEPAAAGQNGDPPPRLRLVEGGAAGETEERSQPERELEPANAPAAAPQSLMRPVHGAAAQEARKIDVAEPRRRRRGRRVAVALAAALVAAPIAAYAGAGALAEAAPALSEPLSAYVAFVDAVRLDAADRLSLLFDEARRRLAGPS